VYSAATASRAGQRAHDRGNEVRRRLKSERWRISDVQIPHLHPGSFHAFSFHGDISNRIGKTADSLGDGDSGMRRAHPSILRDSESNS
jgi:hypothetical protein